MIDTYKLKLSLLTLLGTSTFSLAQTLQSPPMLTPNPRTAEGQLPERFTIGLTVINLQDLKVKEGDRISQGQVISDRTIERDRLNSERKDILNSIANIEQMPKPILKSVMPPKELPAADFDFEEVEVGAAEMKLTQARRNYNEALTIDPFITARANVNFAKAGIEQAYRDVELQQKKLEAINGIPGLPPEMLVHETEKLKVKRTEWEKKQAEYDHRMAEYKQTEQARKQEINELQAKVSEARTQLEKAQAKLRAVKEERRQLEYQHEITLAEHQDRANQMAIALSQQNLQRQSKLTELKEKLVEIEEKKNRLAVVRSPYTGTIKRVKTEGQSDNTIRITLTLIPREVKP